MNVLLCKLTVMKNMTSKKFLCTNLNNQTIRFSKKKKNIVGDRLDRFDAIRFFPGN